MTAAEFCTAVEGLMAEARAKGLSNEALPLEIEDVVSLLREGLACGPVQRAPHKPGRGCKTSAASLTQLHS
jgi:hypothetical protein